MNDQSHRGEPPPSISAWRAAHLIERLARALRAGDYSAGLNPAQWEALRYLSRANRFSRTPAALASYLGASRGTVSQTLIALESKGLIRKTRSRSDGRSVDIEVAEKGRRVLAEDGERDLARDIAACADAAALTADLERVLSQALARRGGKMFGVCKTCRYFRRDAAARRCALLDEPLSALEAEAICAEMEAA